MDSFPGLSHRNAKLPTAPLQSPGAMNEGTNERNETVGPMLSLQNTRGEVNHGSNSLPYDLWWYSLWTAMSDIFGATIEHVVKGKSVTDTFRIAEDIFVGTNALRWYVRGWTTHYWSRSLSSGCVDCLNLSHHRITGLCVLLSQHERSRSLL